MNDTMQAPPPKGPTTKSNRGRPRREVTAARAPEKPLEEVLIVTTEARTVEVSVQKPGCKCPACCHNVVPRVKKTDKLYVYMECPDCGSPFRVTKGDPKTVQLL